MVSAPSASVVSSGKRPGHALRVLLAKIGLDGHDRGVKVLARAFRDAGIEVVYTGLWQTPAITAHAALQEDVDILGVSLHSAAHMTIMPEVLRLQQHFGISDVPLVLGGIVPAADFEPLKEMGVSAVFSPGSAISDIVSQLHELSDARPTEDVSTLIAAYGRGEIRALSRLITRLQRDQLPVDFAPPTGNARVIGITGAPGVGKSSFISRLSDALRRRHQRVAVVAVDPTSPVTGGALLGDRLRMMRRDPDADFFVRSLASHGAAGGVGPKLPETVALLSGAGFDTILLETVGIGQSDTAITTVTPHVLLLTMPQSGDDIQFAKAGVMEVASGFVVNKRDLPGADTTHRQLSESLARQAPVFQTSSVQHSGFDAVADWIETLS